MVMAEKNTREWKHEVKHLGEMKGKLEKNIEVYLNKKEIIDKKTKELYDNYHSNNPELISDLMVSLDIQDQTALTLQRNLKASLKPYFGRIDFSEERKDVYYSFYIGKSGIADENGQMLIVDWRAPISSVYYESDIGKSEYTAPGGMIPVNLDLKRTFEIENAALYDYYDTEVVANDDFLLKYLSKNKEVVLGEIIATIQKEQNAIIRDTPWHSVVVQGVAGSGKTTVAMHRISYILYNFPARFKPQEFYVIGSNRMLLGYITGMLPDLDVRGINQMTMEELFVQLLGANYLPKAPKKLKTVDKNAVFVGSIGFFDKLTAYMDNLERELIKCRDIVHNGALIMTAEEISSYISGLSAHSFESKLTLLNDRLQLLLTHKYDSRGDGGDEVKEILRKYRNYFGKPNQKIDVGKLYSGFLTAMIAESSHEDIAGLTMLLARHENGERELHNLCMLAYIKTRMKTAAEYQSVKHMVVDEAQDFGVMIFYALKTMLRGCTFTVMGDVSQNINYFSGMNGWNTLTSEVFNEKEDRFYVLSKSYRNTIEISQYAAKVLNKCSFEAYAISPVIRSGRQVEEISAKDGGEMLRLVRTEIEGMNGRGYDTIAVICRTAEEAELVREALTPEAAGKSYEDMLFTKGVMTLPISLTKGLEFDAVILYDASSENYRVNDADAKLLYVAITRALHELSVVYTGEKSKLLE